jgi:hypothetical protein
MMKSSMTIAQRTLKKCACDYYLLGIYLMVRTILDREFFLSHPQPSQISQVMTGVREVKNGPIFETFPSD